MKIKLSIKKALLHQTPILALLLLRCVGTWLPLYIYKSLFGLFTLSHFQLQQSCLFDCCVCLLVAWVTCIAWVIQSCSELHCSWCIGLWSCGNVAWQSENLKYWLPRWHIIRSVRLINQSLINNSVSLPPAPTSITAKEIQMFKMWNYEIKWSWLLNGKGSPMPKENSHMTMNDFWSPWI